MLVNPSGKVTDVSPVQFQNPADPAPRSLIGLSNCPLTFFSYIDHIVIYHCTLKYILEFSYTTVHGTNYSHTISKTAASRDTSMCETGKLGLDLMEPEASFFCQAKI